MDLPVPMTWFVNTASSRSRSSGRRNTGRRVAVRVIKKLTTILWFVVMCVFVAASNAVTVADANNEAGKRIFREGRLTSGGVLSATGQSGVSLSGKQAACVNCHRRSGWGAYEGSRPVRPVTAPELFSDRELVNVANLQTQNERSGVRPAYNNQTLLNALVDGVDSRGRTLDSLMPRYDLNATDFAALYAYLKTLSAAPTPGVSASEIHFATLVGADVDAKKRTAMLDVLNGYFADKNSESRMDTRRAQQALHSRERMYERYRKWVLHVWELKGDETTWPAQLQAFYRSQAVFAVLGGMVSGSWAPIHAVCEQLEVPCVFPNSELPVLSNTDFYTLYFSQGRALDGRVVATWLRDDPPGLAAGPVVQVFSKRPGGDIEANSLRADLTNFAPVHLVDYAVPSETVLTPSFWETLLSESRPTTLILWLGVDELPDLASLNQLASRPIRIVLAGRRLDLERIGKVPDGGINVYLAYPYELPSTRSKQSQRMRSWMRLRKIEMTDDILQPNTFFALALAGEVLKHMPPDFSREYFIERIEDMAETTPVFSTYHNVSLGPNQRYASKGAYMVRLTHGNGEQQFTDVAWIVP
ncbi:MAG: hypothetical protein HY273_14100 [Gammaproteobacteria bacterium]|nr:hypothetical protein [Gammaproteobacteria bacterium]